jgi:hypothetical protein
VLFRSHHGTQEELWADCGFDTQAIVKAVKEMTKFEDKSSSNQKVS